MDGTGQYRTRGADELGHTAFVSDRSISFDIGEQLYRWRGYKPAFDDLPWVEAGDVDAKLASMASPRKRASDLRP